MFNKKVFLLLCSFGASLVPATGLAMDDTPLSGPFNSLMYSMSILKNTHSFAPDLQEQLTRDITQIIRVLRPDDFELGMQGRIDPVDVMNAAMVNHNYEQMISGYYFLLGEIQAKAWGLLAPNDIPLLQQERDWVIQETGLAIARDYPDDQSEPNRVAQALAFGGAIATMAVSICMICRLVSPK